MNNYNNRLISCIVVALFLFYQIQHNKDLDKYREYVG